MAKYLSKFRLIESPELYFFIKMFDKKWRDIKNFPWSAKKIQSLLKLFMFYTTFNKIYCAFNQRPYFVNLCPFSTLAMFAYSLCHETRNFFCTLESTWSEKLLMLNDTWDLPDWIMNRGNWSSKDFFPFMLTWNFTSWLHFTRLDYE